MTPDVFKVGDIVRTLRPAHTTYSWSAYPLGVIAAIRSRYGDADVYDIVLIDGSCSYLWWNSELEKLDPGLVAAMGEVHSIATKRIEELEKATRSTS